MCRDLCDGDCNTLRISLCTFIEILHYLDQMGHLVRLGPAG